MSGRRILLWGGGGKTTLSRALADRLDLPVVELDALHWLPGWTPREADAFRALVHTTLDGYPDGWIVDGQYVKRLGDSVLARADTLIWLDLPWRTVFGRVFCRALVRAWDRAPICGDNVESWRQTFFSTDSLLLYHIRQRLNGERARSNRKRARLLARHAHRVTAIRLRSARELDRFYQAHHLRRGA